MKFPLLLTFVFLFHFCLNVNAQQHCSLTPAMIQSDNHVLFVLNSLLRESYVNYSDPLDWSCRTSVLNSSCINGVINSYPQNNCGSNDLLRSLLQWITSNDCTAPFTLYSVGFQSPSNGHAELYRICYFPDYVTTVYSEHVIYRTGYTTLRQDYTWTLDNVTTSGNASSYSAASVYATFNALLGPNQRYVTSPNHVVINRGHLAASADFYYMEHKRATFKYINAIPQFATINNQNWKYIENWIRNGYNPTQTTVRVKTSTRGVLKLPHSVYTSIMVPMYLSDNRYNPIPEWILKTLDDYLVLAVYNNPYATSLPNTFTCVIPIACPQIPGLVYNNFAMGYTICCRTR